MFELLQNEMLVDTLKSFAYFFMTLIFLWISKLFRDISTRNVYDDHELTQKDNVAFGIYSAGFYAGVMIGIIGLFVGPEDSFWQEVLWFWLYGITIIVCIGFNYVITQKCYLKKILIMPEILRQNTAVSVFVLGRFLFAGLVLMSSVHGEGSWFTCLGFYLIGEFCCWVGFQIYLWVTPYDDLKAIKQNHLSVAFVCLGFMVALGVLFSGLFWHHFVSYEEMLYNAIYFLVFLLLLLVFRKLGSRLLFPKSSLKKEIYEDNNLGVGIMMCFFYISISVLLLFSF